MFGIHLHGHKHDAQKQQAEAPSGEAPVEVPTPELAAGGPIPSVHPDAEAQVAEQETIKQSASEQAYDASAPRNYKDKSWANRSWEALDDHQRALIDGLNPGKGEEIWGGLDVLHHAGFLNITAAMKSNGFPTTGLKLNPLSKDKKTAGIQQDRLIFTPESASKLKSPLDDAIRECQQRNDKGFIEDKPEEKLHPGMAQWGGRQWCTRFSMQVGGGDGGAFVDIDEFGPKVDVVGTIGHMGEVIRNAFGHKQTDPFTVGKGLHARGDDP